jgi:ORF6N domain
MDGGGNRFSERFCSYLPDVDNRFRPICHPARMADSAGKTASLELVAAPVIEKRIFVVRERQVMLDEDLADLYGVETKRLVEQVKRNLERFPDDFMFQLSREEAAALRSQIATSNASRGGRRYAPYVFTEQGVAMLSGVLRSERAIAVNIEIMRAFVELRRAASSYAAIEERLKEIEREIGAKAGRARPAAGSNLQDAAPVDLPALPAEATRGVSAIRRRGLGAAIRSRISADQILSS